MAVKKQNKISKVKRNNQKKNKLTKQGKIKNKRNKVALKTNNQVPPPKNDVVYSDSEESDHGQGMLEMVEKDDLSFLQKAVAEKSTSYSLLNKIRFKDKCEPIKQRKRKPNLDGEDNEIESRYEEENVDEKNSKRTKLLLPIKTKSGLIMRSVDEEIPDDEDEEVKENIDHNMQTRKDDDDSDDDDIFVLEDDNEIDPTKPVSVAELFAKRQAELQKQKFRIGVFCSGLLESPEKKVKHFNELLYLLDDSKNGTTNLFTIRKLAAVSIFEVFRDILPEYQIKHQENTGIKLKKDTLQLQSYETTLLNYYKKYLQKLEKMTAPLKKKLGKKLTDSDKKLAEIAIRCMCSLLESHPYFNFSQNIAKMLVPFLNHNLENIRAMICNCCKTIFKNDKRGDISLVIVRAINHLLKAQSHDVYTDALACLLALRIQDVNLDAEKEEEIRQKKFMTRKQKLLKLSKRERKRNKKLEELEKEMLETKAEENKQAKQKQMTEITKVLFTIYFRILKRAPNSKVLSVALEGLSKFSHVINLELYSDLVDVLNSLMQPGDDDDDEKRVLNHRDQLMCVQTVFSVLSGQGECLNIDPLRFYTHLYRNLMHINAGRTNIDLETAVKTLCHVLIRRRKQLSQQRLLAFLKRCMQLSLHQLHNGTISLLGVIRTVMQQGKNSDLLLDTDNTLGTGKYDPYLDEPEFCNASSTALYELSIASRHFHPIVRKMAVNIASNVPATGEGSLAPDLGKLSPEQLLKEFDGSQMCFNPPVPPPKKNAKPSKYIGQHIFVDSEFGDYCEKIMNEPIEKKINCVANLKKHNKKML